MEVAKKKSEDELAEICLEEYENLIDYNDSLIHIKSASRLMKKNLFLSQSKLNNDLHKFIKTRKDLYFELKKSENLTSTKLFLEKIKECFFLMQKAIHFHSLAHSYPAYQILKKSQKIFDQLNFLFPLLSSSSLFQLLEKYFYHLEQNILSHSSTLFSNLLFKYFFCFILILYIIFNFYFLLFYFIYLSILSLLISFFNLFLLLFYLIYFIYFVSFNFFNFFLLYIIFINLFILFIYFIYLFLSLLISFFIYYFEKGYRRVLF